MTANNSLSQKIRATIRRSPISWAHACKIQLRPYQRDVARAIKDSIINHRGLTFVIVLPRQSGKNELQAHLFSWLLFRYARVGGRIVSVSPTFKPQTTNNMQRVKSSLDACIGTRGLWKSSKGYMYTFGKACLQFFSGEPRANVVGATADLLLSVDEAQSITPAKFDKDFDPMTASTNATRVFWGTAWTSNTLLERERRVALQAQQKDGIQRVFCFTADDIRQLVPEYGLHVDRVIAEHGRNHPRVCSQYFGEIIDAQSGMFPARRLALMLADQPAQTEPIPGTLYAMTVDVGGQDEGLMNLDGMGNPGRDYVTVDIHDVDLSSLETLQAPTYRCINRNAWQGENHVAIFGKLCALIDAWNIQYIVLDATGVGEGLWGMLFKKYPARVIPVKFSQQTKSELGYAFISVIETGRFRDCARTPEVELQYQKCRSDILIGPARTMRWGVPDGTRGPAGELIHDDFVIADSLVSKLDELEWYLGPPTLIVPGIDPLDDMSFFKDIDWNELRRHY